MPVRQPWADRPKAGFPHPARAGTYPEGTVRAVYV